MSSQETDARALRRDDKFRADALDIRLEIVNSGVTGLLIVLGWGGVFWSGLTALHETPKWPNLAVCVALFLLGLICIWSGSRRHTLWICAWGTLGLGLVNLLLDDSGASVAWLAISSMLVALLLGSGAGWLAVAATLAGLGASVLVRQPGSLTIGYLTNATLPALVLVLITQIVMSVLLRTVRWMSGAYDVARQHSDELRDKSAELSLAIKSLGQTSFALARANEQLEIMVKYAEDARRSKQEFAANISHELRTPLNLIMGFSDVILNAPSTYYAERLPPKLLADIMIIHRNAQQLSSLVNDILDLSQMDVNYMTIVREPVRIGEFIQSALKDFEPLAQGRGLKLEMRIPPDLPEIYADCTRIRQVLLNLVNNALRFTDTGRITIRAHRAMIDGERWAADATLPTPNTATPTSDHVVISVSDTGTGIAPADLQRIFEPFTQADSSAHRRRGGSGLGLTISKRFVELHGGRMGVESELGVGSTFYFSLPVRPPVHTVDVVSTPRVIHRHEVGTLAVVEQNATLSRLLERHIQGIPVIHANSINELTASSKTYCPEAVLINEPFNPALLPAQWPSELKHVPVIRCYLASATERMVATVSGRSGASLSQEAVDPAGDAAGDPDQAYHFLPKPITRERLYRALAQMLVQTAPEAPQIGEDNEFKDGHPARVLVVEDDEDTLRLLSRMLRLASAEMTLNYTAIIPIECHNGEEAIEFLRSPAGQELDGMLLDIQLGAVSGFDVLHEMETDDRLRRLPFCIISGAEVHDEPLVTPYFTLTRQGGLTVRELTQAIAAIMQVVLPGVEVSVPQPTAT